MMHLFSYGEGGLLIKLFLVHFIADFLLQTSKSINDKKDKILGSTYFWVHIAIIFATTYFVLWSYENAFWYVFAISSTHAVIDAAKLYADKSSINFKRKDTFLFIIDQLLHCVVIIIAWAILIGKYETVGLLMQQIFNSYKVLVVGLGYLLVIGPVTYLIKFLTVGWANQVNIQNNSLENAGKWIGILERLIVLTLVLIEQYEAIGFLIAAKSLLRLTDKLDIANNNNAQNIPATQQMVTARKLTEYVLIGTFLSFGFAMAIGFAIKWLMNM